MARRWTADLIGSPGWYICQGLFFGWIGTAAASDVTRGRLFWIGLAMIFVMFPLELWWYLKAKPTAS